MPQDAVTLSREDLRRNLVRGRVYVWPPYDPDPRTYKSVTNILNSIPKEFLSRWAAKVVAETAVFKIDLLNDMADNDPEAAIKWLKGAPWGQRDRAAEIGTAVHLVAELDAAGRHDEADAIIADLPLDGQRKAHHARDFFRSVALTIDHVECVVFSDAHGYAGTLDFIVTITDPDVLQRIPFVNSSRADSVRVLLDVKTGKGIYPEVALQLAAYRWADSMVDLATGELTKVPGVHGGAALHVTEDGWSLIPVDTTDEPFDAFLAAAAMSNVTPLSPALVGPPVARGRA